MLTHSYITNFPAPLFSSLYFSQEDTDLSGHLTYITTDPNLEQVTGISPQSCSLPYLTSVCEKEISHRPETSLHAEHVKVETSLDTSSSHASDDSDDLGIIENCPIRNEARPSSHEDEQGEKNCTSIQNLEHLPDLPVDSLVEISQHSNTMCDGNKNGDQSLSCQETPTIQLHQVSDAIDDNKATRDDDDVQMIEDMEPDTCEEQAAKKRRLMPLQDGSDDGIIMSESNL